MTPISQSEIKSFARCRLQWFWTAAPPRGLNLQPRVVRAALNTGRIVHAALQEYYDKGVDPVLAYTKLALDSLADLETKVGMWDSEREKAKDELEEMVGVMAGFARWAPRYEFLATETTFGMQEEVIIAGQRARGRLDAVVEREDGLWVLDFKTTSYTNTDWTTQDLQATFYTLGARHLFGRDVRGVLFWFIRKKRPWTYEDLVLKSGGLTQRRDVSSLTTLENYMQALGILAWLDLHSGTPMDAESALREAVTSDHRPDWFEAWREHFVLAQRAYFDQIQQLKSYPNSFYWEVTEARTLTELEMYTIHLLRPVMWEMTHSPWVGPTGLSTAFASCRSCAFSEPCKLAMQGADFRSLLRENYEERDEYEVT